MFFLYFGRGWASEDDMGINTNYYLYNGLWYRIISPELSTIMTNDFTGEGFSNMFYVGGRGTGGIGSERVDVVSSGVQLVYRIMLLFI